jgi:hypothetical protein
MANLESLDVYDGECGRVQELHREEGDRAKAHALPYLIMQMK